MIEGLNDTGVNKSGLNDMGVKKRDTHKNPVESRII